MEKPNFVCIYVREWRRKASLPGGRQLGLSVDDETKSLLEKILHFYPALLGLRMGLLSVSLKDKHTNPNRYYFAISKKRIIFEFPF